MLDVLSQSGAGLPFGQGAKEWGVQADAAGMLKVPTLFLPPLKIDARLAADGGIHHSKEGGGNQPTSNAH